MIGLLQGILFYKLSWIETMYHRDDFSLKKVEDTDLEMVLKWRNSERNRATMYTHHIITPEKVGVTFQKIWG